MRNSWNFFMYLSKRRMLRSRKLLILVRIWLSYQKISKNFINISTNSEVTSNNEPIRSNFKKCIKEPSSYWRDIKFEFIKLKIELNFMNVILNQNQNISLSVESVSYRLLFYWLFCYLQIITFFMVFFIYFEFFLFKTDQYPIIPSFLAKNSESLAIHWESNFPWSL